MICNMKMVLNKNWMILMAKMFRHPVGMEQSHGYADDLQIYGHCPTTSIAQLSASVVSCIDALNSWFSSNRLKLNPSKTEFSWLGSPRRLPSSLSPIILGGCTVVPTSVVRDLGFYLDSHLSFSAHISC